jgi:hypothetical protein
MKTEFKRAITITIGLLAAAGAAVVPVAAHASVTGPRAASAASTWECAGTHNGNQHLAANQEIFQNGYRCAGNYEWIIDSNGSLSEYLKSKADLVWSTHTGIGLSSSLLMQNTGNLVLQTGLASIAWSTHTAGHPGAYVCFQIDGNLVVYATDGLFDCAGTPLYANGH